MQMRHRANQDFWEAYDGPDAKVRRLADRNFKLLKRDPKHPSLHFKKVADYWSARVGRDHRAFAVATADGFVWFWIGSHSQYDLLIQS